MINYVDLLGKKFKYGASGPDAYDCKNLMVELYRRKRIEFPDYDSTASTEEQSAAFAEGLSKFAVKLDAPEEGCLVMFRIIPPYVSHVGMVIDQYRFIHISRGSSVSVERLDSIQWVDKIAGFYRLTNG
jgi:cell wall-associated NlpC family hydrolase